MKRLLSILPAIVKIGLLIFALSILLLTLFSALTWNRTNGSELFGYRFLTVLSNSMSPVFEAGDVVVIGQADPELLAEGDVISFYSPDPDYPGTVVTHQIDRVTHTGGNPFFFTKGISSSCDVYPVPSDQVIGIYCARLPKAGYLVQFMKSPPGYLLLILFPFFAILCFQTVRFFHLLFQYRQQKLDEIERKQRQLDRALQEMSCSLTYNLYLTEQLEGLLDDVRK